MPAVARSRTRCLTALEKASHTTIFCGNFARAKITGARASPLGERLENILIGLSYAMQPVSFGGAAVPRSDGGSEAAHAGLPRAHPALPQQSHTTPTKEDPMHQADRKIERQHKAPSPTHAPMISPRTFYLVVFSSGYDTGVGQSQKRKRT